MNNEDLPTGPGEGGTSVIVAGSGLSDLEIDLELNSVCDAFESAWQTGRQPQLADFLTDTRLPVSTLFVELVQIEMEYRRRKGEPVTLDEYVARYPEFSEALSKLAPSLDTVSLPASPEGATKALGRFELVAPLGEGTFGVVWKARDTKLRRWVAIKRFRETAPAPSRDLFAREARAVQKLNHPNVVRLLELSQGATTDYIVFEYVEGRTLKKILDEQNHAPLDADRAARIALQLANGLQHIHERGLIHRDLKPANVMITPAGDAKILDFGLARHTDTTSTIGGGQGFLGTVPYMSPEQLQGGMTVTQQSDIYAVGTVLYEMLSGRRPFDGLPKQLVAMIVEGSPPPIEAPAPLKTIIRRAMELDPRDRYPSAGDLADDLQRYLAGKTLKKAGSPLRKLTKALVNRRGFLAGAAGAIATGSASFAILNAQRQVDDGKVWVSLTTTPENAQVAFVPLDPINNQPNGHALIRASSPSPVRERLSPGDYLVVAYLEDGSGRFHEVYRHVPEDPSVMMHSSFAHTRWKRQPDGTIELSAVKIPPADVTERMTRLAGAERFSPTLIRDLETAPDAVTVRPFFVDRHELTVGEYRDLWTNLTTPETARKHVSSRAAGVPDDWAMPMLSFEEVIARAEQVGKRLLHEWEYEFLATAGGTSVFPWGDLLPAEERWPDKIGPVGDVPFDRYEFEGTSIHGLCSNLAEWVDSPMRGPKLWAADGRPQLGAAGLATVRGGNPRALLPSLETDMQRFSPRKPFPFNLYSMDRGIGVRFARSVKPRLDPADFTRLL